MRPLTRNAAFDGLRGFAVLLVFCVHAAGNAAHVFLNVDLDATRWARLSTPDERVLLWLNRSHHGVFLFFVLSGFLIARMWSAQPRPGYVAFAGRRTARIYPAFLLSFAGSLLFAFHSGTWQPPDWPRLATNLVFANGVPAWHIEPFNLVTWSLFYEVVFYASFPLLLLAGWRVFGGRVGTFVVAVLGVAVPVLAVAVGADPINLCWSLLFLGVVAGQRSTASASPGWRPPSIAVIGLYLAVTTLALFDVVSPILLTLAFGVAAVFIVQACDHGDNFLARMFAFRPLATLGRISYSFYLWHWMVVVLVARAFEPLAQTLGIHAGAALFFAASFLASLGVAAVAWGIAERPYFRRRALSPPGG